MVLLCVPSKTIQTGYQQWVFCELLEPSDHMSARSESDITLFLYGSGPLVANRHSHLHEVKQSSCYVHIVQSRPRHLFPYEIYGMPHFFAPFFLVLTARHSRTELVNYFSSSHMPIFRRKCE